MMNTVNGQDLRGADLRGKDLVGANLPRVDARGATLVEANLAGSNFRGSDFRGADFRGADLRGATLAGGGFWGANLNGADLTGADLTGATLAGADLTDAVMVGVVGVAAWDEQVALLERIRDAVLANPDVFEMSGWHSPCGTTHCLAGWSQHLSGVEGHPAVVGSRLIPVAAPMFLADTTTARRWLENREWRAQERFWIGKRAS